MKFDFKSVLYVAPEYKGQKGGMASVLEVYARSIDHFQFLSTYIGKGAFFNVYYFVAAYFKFIGRLITDRQLKIIHLHSASRGSFLRKSIFLLTAKLFGKKTVLHIHGGEFRLFYDHSGFFKKFIRYVLKKTDVLVCLSVEWKAYFDSLTGTNDTLIVNNPVEMQTNLVQPKLGFPLRVLFLNRIYKEKGIYDILELFNENEKELAGQFKFIIAGDGENETVKIFIEQNNLAGMVEFKGWVSGRDKEAVIRDCHLFILTSYAEGLPMSILEAMTFAKPVLATNVGGIPQIVRPGENGWLVKPGDKASILNILREIKKETGVLGTYGEGSLQLVQGYSAQKVIDHLHNIYMNLFV